jgi:hypothetical protein
MNTWHVIKVFLASPNDLAPERAAASEVFARVNALAGRYLNFQFQLLRWEDIGPEFARPQAVINQMVDDCDLFIGMLWKRWGQSTGEFSSGFQEEFERAKARNLKDGSPGIWLYLKKLDPTGAADPGEQLQRVLAFREAQQKADQIFYKEFEQSDDWSKLLHDRLIEYSLARTRRAENTETIHGSELGASQSLTPAVAANAAGEASDISGVEVSRQLQDSVDRLRASILKSGQGFADDHDSLSALDVVRTFLAAHTLLSRRVGTLLAVHEFNAIYKQRKDLEVVPSERRELNKATISDSTDTFPGWFWLAISDLDEALFFLLDMVLVEVQDDVKVGAMRLINDSGLRVPVEIWPALPVGSEVASLREEALEAIAIHGDLESQAYLDSLQADEQLTDHDLRDARFNNLVRLNPSEALLRELRDDLYIPERHLDSLEKSVGRVDDGALRVGVVSANDRIKLICMTELKRRGILTPEEARTGLESPRFDLRSMSLDWLIELGGISDVDEVRRIADGKNDLPGPFGALSLLGGADSISVSDKDALLVKFFRAKTSEELNNLVDWFSVDGSRAYGALILNGDPEALKFVRSDLATSFKRVREGTLERVRLEHGDAAAEYMLGKFAPFDEFTESTFVRSALLGIERSPTFSDADLVRPFVEKNFSTEQLSAIRVLREVGTDQDVDLLVATAASAYGQAKNEAIEAAFKLSSDPIELALTLFRHKDGVIRAAAVTLLSRDGSQSTRDLFEKDLHSKNSEARIQAIKYMSSHLGEAALQDLLDRYLSDTAQYYYNVVTWIDRLAYAPVPFLEMYKTRLRNEQL